MNALADKVYKQALPRKKAQAVTKSKLRSKQSSKGILLENFMTIGGCFECYTYRVMALGCLKKEDE